MDYYSQDGCRTMKTRDIDASYFGHLFVEVAKRETSRVSYHSHRENEGFAIAITRTGKGNIPFDTGNLQNNIFVSRVTPTSCTVKMTAPYAVFLQYCENVGRTSVPNSHKNFLQKFVAWEYANEVRKQFPRVDIQ